MLLTNQNAEIVACILLTCKRNIFVKCLASIAFSSGIIFWRPIIVEVNQLQNMVQKLTHCHADANSS